MNFILKSSLIGIFLFIYPSILWANESLNLRILHFNDVYEVASQTDPLGEKFAGVAELKTLITQKRKEAENSLVTFGGDLFPATIEGTPLSYEDKIKLVNHLGIDGAVLGNHEFDHGVQETLSIVELSTFPWIIDNVEYKSQPNFGKTIPYKVFTFGDYKIALIGFILPETETMSFPGPDVHISKVIPKAKGLVSKLKKDGVDVIIGLTHQTLQEDENLLMAVQDIDLILGGHEHRPITYFVNQRQMIFKTGYDARFLGIIDLKIERYHNQQGNHIFMSPSWQMIPVRNLEPDPTLHKMIQELRNKIPKYLFEPLAKLDVSLDSRRSQVDSKRTSMGTVISNALKNELEAQIAIINGGSIRGDRIYTKGSTLSRQNIMQELPFEDYVSVYNISGAELKRWLENSLADAEDPNGSFFQISGFTFSYDLTAPSGKRVKDIRIEGKPLDFQKAYSLATVNYLASGKDGFTKLTSPKKQNIKLPPSEIVINYLKKRKVVTQEDVSLR